MKPIRVTITFLVLGALVVAIFTVPLPVSRVSAQGVVEIRPNDIVSVYVDMAQKEDEKAILEELKVEDGQMVKKDEVLAHFSNRQLDAQMVLAQRDVERELNNLAALEKERDATRDEREQAQFAAAISRARGALTAARANYEFLQIRLNKEKVVRAPRDGLIIGLPNVEYIGRQWDRKQPLCRIGNPDALRVLIPIEPSDYSLLQENLGGLEGDVKLPANIRVHGHGRDSWLGEVSKLPESEAVTIPLALSSKANGPVAVKPGGDPDTLIPQAQQYLVSVELTGADAKIRPGVLARVKVHCKKRTMAWWIWRKVNDTFNLGLI